MNGALPVHESAECKNKESNVGAAAALIDVKSSDMLVVVDVVADEGRSYEGVEDIIIWGG